MSLWDPTDCSLSGYSVRGILQARILEWAAISFSRGSSWPRGRTQVYRVSCTGMQALHHWATRDRPQTTEASDKPQFSSVQSLSRVRLFVTPWIAARQAALSITNSQSLPKIMLIKLVVPSSHLILCHPLLLLPPIPPSIRVFSNESTLRMRWPKYWSFNLASVLPMNTQAWSPLGRTGWISLKSKGSSRVFSYTTVQNIYKFIYI